MSDAPNRPPLRRCGSMWKPRPGTKIVGSGIVTVRGWRQRFIVVENTKKSSDRDSDFKLLTSDEPVPDTPPSGGTTAAPPEDQW